jgi:hypothetical protein
MTLHICDMKRADYISYDVIMTSYLGRPIFFIIIIIN